MTRLDTLIKNVRVVRASGDGAEDLDLGIAGGKFARIEANIPADSADRVIDGGGMLAFPGLVDGHMHVGIYQPLEKDARSESKAAISGGVTSALNYIRTGQYYLNRGGTHPEFYADVLERSSGNFYSDYAYHLAPINRHHIDDMELMLREYGVASFKIFMFYGGHGLHGRSHSQRDFLMLEEGERYDVAHFEFIMRELARIHQEVPGAAENVSLSLHCEFSDILAAYTEMVEREGKLTGLRAYSASRPPHSEGLAIFIAAFLANETCFPSINLLHLSSAKAIESALAMQTIFPHIDFKKEVTVGHLMLDVDSEAACHAKVNPPIRPREDVERLWKAVLDGDIDWVVSDHACCSEEKKVDANDPDDIFKAKSGFGGSEYVLSAMLTEGRQRGLSLNRIAQLTATNPAKRFALHGKGDLAVGMDADVALVDEGETFVVRADESPSAQGYTPFEGMELSGKVRKTLLRGELVFDDGQFAEPSGRYLKRPYGSGEVA